MGNSSLNIEEITDSIENGWQLPAALYSSPVVYDIEQEQIFKKSWLFVARLDQLKNVGDFVTANLGKIPVVITRDSETSLSGIVNSCLHRLHPIAKEAEGCTRIFQCKYHGWTYGLDGQLKTAPRSQGEANFDRAEMHLPKVRVETFGHLVFANADLDAQPLAEYLGIAPEKYEELGLNFDGWDFTGSFTYEIEANWKLFSENSLECYHCDLVHHDTFASLIATDPENYICDNYENFLTQVAPMSHTPKTETRPVEDLDKFRFMFIWPATFYSVDEYAGVVARLVPAGPKRTRWVVDAFSRPGVDKEVLESWVDMYNSTFEEDKVAVGAQQAGYDSGAIVQGRLLPSNESSIQMFQRRTWAVIAPYLEGVEV